MKTCTVCRNTKSKILMNNRLVCFRCDELLFDIELENDDAELVPIDKPKPKELNQVLRKQLK